MRIDLSAASRRVSADTVRDWLAEQRVFISSQMGDTPEERSAVADAIADEGAVPVWFEEFGRDASAEEAYLTEVDSCTVYVGIAGKVYGRLNPPGFAATELEYMRARERGKRVVFYVAADSSGREGHLTRFIERVQFDITTEAFSDAADVARRVRKRLHQLAAEALSPWVRLGDTIFRADVIDDAGDTVTIKARVSDPIAHDLESMRDQRYGRSRLRVVYGGRAIAGELATLRRTTRAGTTELEIGIVRVDASGAHKTRAATTGMSADDLVERGMRSLFLGEKLPDSLGMMEFLADTGIDATELREASDSPNEIAEAITQLVITDGLVGSGRASRVVRVSVGPRTRDRRHLVVVWEAQSPYDSTKTELRTIEGVWLRPQPAPAG